MALAVSLAGLAASAEPIATGIPNPFASKGDATKTQEIRALNRAMRRLDCGSQTSAVQTCRRLMASLRSLSAEAGTGPAFTAPRARVSPQPKRAPIAPQSRWGNAGSSYRTMCVRLCDGFYYPVSEASKPASFPADEARCQSSCGAPAKLFYMPGADTEPEQMLSLSGERYRDLANAFRYRNEYDVTCSCQPLPWSPAGKAALERRALLAARTLLETQVAAGAGEAAKLLAESRIEMAEAKPRSKAQPPARKVRPQVVMRETTVVRPRFRLFGGQQPSLAAPADKGAAPPPRRFFLFR